MNAVYNPYLVARIEAVLRPEADRLGAITAYDYMGSAEFEFGAIPASFAAMRIKMIESLNANGTTGFEIVQAPESFNLVATHGHYAGKNVYALASTETFAKYGDSFWEALRKLADWECRCKEWTAFDHSFSKRSSEMHYAAWHDILNDIFFSFSVPYLMAIRALLSRDLMITNMNVLSNHVRMGDEIEIVYPMKGSATGYHPSVEKWKVIQGKIAGIHDDHVTVKSHGQTYRAPWALMLSTPADLPLPVHHENLDALLKRRH